MQSPDRSPLLVAGFDRDYLYSNDQNFSLQILKENFPDSFPEIFYSCVFIYFGRINKNVNKVLIGSFMTKLLLNVLIVIKFMFIALETFKSEDRDSDTLLGDRGIKIDIDTFIFPS